MGPRGRGAGPETPGEEVAPPQQEGPDQPRPPHPGKGRRQAPEVTREWPAAGPAPRPPTHPWPLVLMAGLLALVFMGLVPGLTPPPSPRRPPSGPMPRDACPAEQAARWTGYPLDAPGRGGPGTSRSTASRVPEVTHEWPAEAPRHAVEPLDVPVLAAAAAGLAATILLVPSIDDRGGVLLAALLIYLAAATILVVASRWAMTSEERALRRAGEWPIMRRTPPSEGHMMVG